MKRCLILIVLAAAVSVSLQVPAAEQAQWTGEPIPVHLIVNQERRLVIADESEVRVGVPASAAGTILVQSIGRNVWLTALAPVESSRILLQAQPSGTTIILQISAEANQDQPAASAARENLLIALPESSPAGPVRLTPPPGFAALTRFAVRELYAPPRLRLVLGDINRYPVPSRLPDLFRCGGVNIPSACGGAVEIKPITAWQSPTHFVTAVRLANTLAEPLILDPRDLRGAWRAATFVRSRLMPAGQPDDATLLVLISDAPAGNALER